MARAATLSAEAKGQKIREKRTAKEIIRTMVKTSARLDAEFIRKFH